MAKDNINMAIDMLSMKLSQALLTDSKEGITVLSSTPFKEKYIKYFVEEERPDNDAYDSIFTFRLECHEVNKETGSDKISGKKLSLMMKNLDTLSQSF